MNRMYDVRCERCGDTGKLPVGVTMTPCLCPKCQWIAAVREGRPVKFTREPTPAPPAIAHEMLELLDDPGPPTAAELEEHGDDW